MKFEDFRNKHAGEKILVCGLGESLNLLSSPERVLTIGVNDIGRKFHPTYLLNVNNKIQYKGDRFNFIENTRAKFIFTQNPKEQGRATPPIVKIEFGRETGSVEIVDGKLPHFRNSPYVAVAIAGWMGAKEIGVIGVDFTDNHFWIKDGHHSLIREVDRINAQYGKLSCYLAQKGIEVVNLSPTSKITSLRKVNLSAWITSAASSASATNTFTTLNQPTVAKVDDFPKLNP